jgi:ParB family chromosome partitioning protein
MTSENEITNKNTNERKALGRGLAALIGNKENKTKVEQGDQNTQNSPINQTTQSGKLSNNQSLSDGSIYKEVLIDQIEANPEQPRKHFNQAKLEELSLSLKEHGLVQPIIVKQLQNNKYQIIAGERRWRASKLANLVAIPVIVKNESLNNQINDLASLIENIQREDLNPIEFAQSYDRMINLYSYTQEELAKKLGISRVHVANILRLLKLPEDIKNLVIKKILSEGHARALLGIQNQNYINEIAQIIVSDGLSVRETELKVRNVNNQKSITSKQEPLNHSEIKNNNIFSGLEDELRELIGTKVVIKGNQQKGTIEFYYTGKDSLNRIIHQLRSSKL